MYFQEQEDREKLLYIGEREILGLIKMISKQIQDYVSEFASESKLTRKGLEGTRGIVFIGPQKSTFKGEKDYFSFIDKVENSGIPTFAIILRNETLPQNNKRINRVIKLKDQPFDKIGEKIEQYFS